MFYKEECEKRCFENTTDIKKYENMNFEELTDIRAKIIRDIRKVENENKFESSYRLIKDEELNMSLELYKIT